MSKRNIAVILILLLVAVIALRFILRPRAPPLVFGIMLQEPSYQGNDEKFTWSEEDAKREVDLAVGLGVDFVRIDIYYEMFDQSYVEPTWLDALDEVVSYVRQKNLKLMMGAFGQFHAHNAEKLSFYAHGYGLLKSEDWEALQKDLIQRIIERWKPDSIYMSELPTLMAAQMNQVISIKEWRNITERLVDAAKEKNPNIVTVIGLTCGIKQSSRESLDLWNEFGTSPISSLDIVGFNVYHDSSDNAMMRLRQSVEPNIGALKEKYQVWITEIGLFKIPPNWRCPGQGEYERYLRESISYAKQKGMSGYIWFFFRKDCESGIGLGRLMWFTDGLVGSDWTIRPHYYVYQELIEKN